ncbi:hypothetical protein [Rhodopseudomonas parapalustris]
MTNVNNRHRSGIRELPGASAGSIATPEPALRVAATDRAIASNKTSAPQQDASIRRLPTDAAEFENDEWCSFSSPA